MILDSVAPVRALIDGAIRDAWQLGRIIHGRPIGDEPGEHAVIRLDSVPRSFTGVRTVTETMTFEIVGFFELPDGALVEDLKVSKAQQLGEELLAIDYSEVGAYQPEVPRIEFIEDDMTERFFAVGLVLTVRTDQFQ